MTKAMRARVLDDEQTLKLAGRLAGLAGLEVDVTLTGLPEVPVGRRAAPPETPVLRGAHYVGPRPLTRREIYEDV